MKIFVDTQIWIFDHKIPDKTKYKDQIEYDKYYTIHKKAKKFIETAIRNDEIYMTLQQLCEIYHSLAFRGIKISPRMALLYCSNFINSKFINIYPVKMTDFDKAIQLSSKSNIHVWDYLCVLPIYELVDTLFTCDKHFLHHSFQKLGVQIKNPLNEWFVL